MTSSKKKLSIVTLGCQMNKSDSGWVWGLLDDEYDLTENNEEADFLVINTCAVREKAEQKFFSLLGRLKPLKAKKKNMVIGVAGCIAQERGEEIIKREPFVDIVFGTRAINKLPELLRTFEETGRPQVDISDTGEYDDYPVRRDSSVSAWVPIMRGCNNHCSYCIVPETRGAEQSRPVKSIIEEIKKLAGEGFREITLLGQNVNSFGTGQSQPVDFPELLHKIDAECGIPRIRFITSHPKDLSDRLIDAMADIPSVAPALHLPIQSGSDRILELMNRGYTADSYFEKVLKLRAKVDALALTSDVIVGFPGETDEDFARTAEAVKKARFENIFLFKYSPRPGTPAANLKSDIPPDVVQRRFDEVMSIQKEISKERMASWVGMVTEVLVEGSSKKDKNRFSGRTPQNHLVIFDSKSDFTGSFIHVKIDASRQFSLEGSVA